MGRPDPAFERVLGRVTFKDGYIMVRFRAAGFPALSKPELRALHTALAYEGHRWLAALGIRVYGFRSQRATPMYFPANAASERRAARLFAPS
jgi:hypothetical protein